MAQGEGGLEIIDITNPEEPQTVSVTSEGVRGYSSKVALLDSVVYLAAGSFGVTMLNAIDPPNHMYLLQIQHEACKGFTHHG